MHFKMDSDNITSKADTELMLHDNYDMEGESMEQEFVPHTKSTTPGKDKRGSGLKHPDDESGSMDDIALPEKKGELNEKEGREIDENEEGELDEEQDNWEYDTEVEEGEFEEEEREEIEFDEEKDLEREFEFSTKDGEEGAEDTGLSDYSTDHLIVQHTDANFQESSDAAAQGDVGDSINPDEINEDVDTAHIQVPDSGKEPANESGPGLNNQESATDDATQVEVSDSIK